MLHKYNTPWPESAKGYCTLNFDFFNTLTDRLVNREGAFLHEKKRL